MSDQTEFDTFVDTHFPPGTREVMRRMRKNALDGDLSGDPTPASLAFINVMQKAEARSAPTGKLTWTDEAPNESGRYYLKRKYKDDGAFSVSIVKVAELSGFLFLRTSFVLEDTDTDVTMIDGKWAGPIPYPTD